MSHSINRVTVIGAGTMGAAIAGHLANAGLATHLLDMVPDSLTPQEEAAGLSLQSRAVRNRIVQAGFERMLKAKPANLYVPEMAARITLGNLEDDFAAAVGGSDWIIEAIVERPGPKQALMARIETAAPAHALISSNTSGIPIRIISQGRSADFKRRFLGTHFFNPPRYLHLLELIPTPETDPVIVEEMRHFAARRLGKGVVLCKDTPNFIANRMISFIQSELMEFAVTNGYTVEEVDRLTGPLLGRPKTGTFRLNDVIGIDVMALVSANLYALIPEDEDRVILKSAATTAVMQTLLDANLLGSKSGQGFYRTVIEDGGEKSFWGLDLAAAAQGEVAYQEPTKPRWASVGAARDLPLAERLRRLVDADDRAGELVWHTLSRTVAYASKRIPEIADSIADLDNAMRWGFGWELGPFETWDLLGVQATLERLEGEGGRAASWVGDMLAQGSERFYRYENGRRLAYSPLQRSYLPVDSDPLTLAVADVKRRSSRVLAENESASLLETGDGVLLLEFHTKMNALDLEIAALIDTALERLHGNAAGLVIANDGAHFCAGANLFLIGMLAQTGQWDDLDRAIRGLQGALSSLRSAPKPVVAAPFNMALGGGAEVVMGADRAVAHAESYIGLVEVGVGLIPAAGGCKELVRRRVSPHMSAPTVNPSPYLQQIFEQIGYAKVSSCAAEARSMGYLAGEDRIVMNRDHLLAEARQEVLRMAADGYRPPTTQGNVYAAGKDQLANLRIGIHMLQQGGYISAYDAHIADKLATVLTGGELSLPAWVDERYFLELEREAFKSLCGEAKTQERIWYFLEKGKPLRN